MFVVRPNECFAESSPCIVTTALLEQLHKIMDIAVNPRVKFEMHAMSDDPPSDANIQAFSTRVGLDIDGYHMEDGMLVFRTSCTVARYIVLKKTGQAEGFMVSELIGISYSANELLEAIDHTRFTLTHYNN
jgi:hypothetical protein